MTQNRRRKTATETVKLYNSTDGPLPYDAEGRVVGARESADVPATVIVTDDEGTVTDTPQAVDVDPIAGHVAAGRFIIVDPTADDDDTADESNGDADVAAAATSTPQE